MQTAVLPNPFITGCVLAALSTGLWTVYKNKDKPRGTLGPTPSSTTWTNFDSGVRLAQSYPLWSQYFLKRGYETLYNINHRLISASPTSRILLGLIERHPPQPALVVDCMDMEFQHPIGLGPGFSRDGEGVNGYLDLGFSFIECGTVTLYPQPGNPPRRLFSVEDEGTQNELDPQTPASAQVLLDTIKAQLSSNQTQTFSHVYSKFKALINNMGNPNGGSRNCADHLKKFRDTIPKRLEKRPVGVNINLNASVDNKNGSFGNLQDFLSMYSIISPYANFFVINLDETNAFLPIINNNSSDIKDEYGEVTGLCDNYKFFIEELKKEGISLQDLQKNNISLPNSLKSLPEYDVHYQINPRYAEFVESLLQLRDQSRQFPLTHEKINAVVHHDERISLHYREKLRLINDETLKVRNELDKLMFSEGGLGRMEDENTPIAMSIVVDKSSILTEKLQNLLDEHDQIYNALQEHEFVNAKRKMEYLKSIPTQKDRHENLRKEQILHNTLSRSDQQPLNTPTTQNSPPAAPLNPNASIISQQSQSNQDRIELVSDLIRHDEGEEIDFETFKARLYELDQNITPKNTFEIEGYRVYDRSKLTTLGSMNAIDLSAAWSRKKNTANKPRILFKIAADIQPRLAVLFSKFAVLHGVDGLVIGGAALNEKAFYQPGVTKQHEDLMIKQNLRPAMAPRTDDLTPVSNLLPELTQNEFENLHSQQNNSETDFSKTPIIIIPPKLQPGYISGPILNTHSTRLIATVYQHTDGKIPIIGTGGVSCAQDIHDKMTAGASLVEMHSLLYNDITIVPKLRNELDALVKDEYLEFLSGTEVQGGLFKSDGGANFETNVAIEAQIANNNEFDFDINKKQWRLNTIVGRRAKEFSFYDIDPYVQCYNDFEQIKKQIKKQTEQHSSQFDQNLPKADSSLPIANTDESINTLPIMAATIIDPSVEIPQEQNVVVSAGGVWSYLGY
jgi:dihydroorotate dehydrogenase